MLLIPDEPLHPISSGEARTGTALVFRNAATEITGDADIDRAALLACRHVDIAGHHQIVAAYRALFQRPPTFVILGRSRPKAVAETLGSMPRHRGRTGPWG